MDVNVSAWQHWDFFSCAQFPIWRGGNKRDAVCFFLPQGSDEEKQMTLILGLELTNIKCCSSSESDDKTIWPTVSMAVATFAWCMRMQSSLWNVTHYDSAKRLKDILKGTSTPIKESLKIGGCNICNNASFNFFQKSVYSGEKQISPIAYFCFQISWAPPSWINYWDVK